MSKHDAVLLQQLINGSWRDGHGDELLSLNPAHPTQVVARGANANVVDAADAVAAADGATEAWRRMPHHSRAAILVRAGEILSARAGEIGTELTREEGKCLAEGVGEVRRAAQILDFYGHEADRESGATFASPRGGETIVVRHHPIGVVGVITPFNFPIAIPAWKIAPALSYGNTVVWKPASVVSLLAQRLAEALTEAGLPDGVLNVVVGPGEVGQAVVDDPRVSAVTFTGSTSVGRLLIAACGIAAKPIQAEMGGKNASVVLADADLHSAVSDVLAGAFRGAGQRCTATSRLIVQSAVADEFLAALVERVEAMVLGDPLDSASDMGPVVSKPALDAITGALAGAGSERLLSGTKLGADLDGGYYLAPSVLELATRHHALWRDEVFGPVLSVLRAETVHDAFDLVNDSQFGLSCAVFTGSLTTSLRAMDELNVGVLHINSETGGADPHVPFGGAKASSFGPKEQGRAARDFFTTSRTTYLKPAI